MRTRVRTNKFERQVGKNVIGSERGKPCHYEKTTCDPPQRREPNKATRYNELNVPLPSGSGPSRYAALYARRTTDPRYVLFGVGSGLERSRNVP